LEIHIDAAGHLAAADAIVTASLLCV